MVSIDPQRERYLGGTEGAPPTPPPGGYRGARRAGVVHPTQVPVAPAVASDAKPARLRPNVLGWLAVIASALFLLILASLIRTVPAGTFYQTPLIALQLLLLALIIAALVTPRGRLLGAIALSAALILNIGTAGAISAVRVSNSGDLDGLKSEQQLLEEAFPGIRGVPSIETLANPSLEEIRVKSAAFMADVRRTLTQRFGYTWVRTSAETLRPERNGYGGESMLVRFYSETWAIEQTVHDYSRKIEIMSVIGRVADAHDMWGPFSLNDDPGFDASLTEKLYGSNDPRLQHTWEWYAPGYPYPGWMYITLNDLSNDRTGELRAAREAISASTGEPIEGLRIFYYATEVLSDADRAEFIERMRRYPGR